MGDSRHPDDCQPTVEFCRRVSCFIPHRQGPHFGKILNSKLLKGLRHSALVQMSIRLNFCRSVPPEFLRSFFILNCLRFTTLDIWIYYVFFTLMTWTTLSAVMKVWLNQTISLTNKLKSRESIYKLLTSDFCWMLSKFVENRIPAELN